MSNHTIYELAQHIGVTDDELMALGLLGAHHVRVDVRLEEVTSRRLLAGVLLEISFTVRRLPLALREISMQTTVNVSGCPATFAEVCKGYIVALEDCSNYLSRYPEVH